MRPDVLYNQIKSIRSRIRQFRPDIVHAHFGTITAFATVIAADVPVIITFRGSDLNPSPTDGWMSPLRHEHELERRAFHIQHPIRRV